MRRPSSDVPRDAQGRDPSDPIGRLIELAGARRPVPAERADRVRATVRQDWLSGLSRRRRSRRGAALLAAAAMAGLVVAVPATRERWEADRAAVRIEASQGSVRWSDDALETGEGRAAVRLAGGSALRLDQGTRLRFRSNRVVELERGAVYVVARSTDAESAVPPTAGLVLRTPHGIVRDIGTRFEARLEEATLRIRVREGGVRVGEGPIAVDATIGQEIRIGPSGLVDRRVVPLHGPDWAWTLSIAPDFDLEGRSLADLLAWIAEETGWRVSFADPGLAGRSASIVLHGSIEGVPPDEALAVVAPTVGVSFALEDGVLQIRR